LKTEGRRNSVSKKLRGKKSNSKDARTEKKGVRRQFHWGGGEGENIKSKENKGYRKEKYFLDSSS